MVRLTSPMRYEVGFLGSGWVIDAPEDYHTDLASIPVLPDWSPKWLVRFRDWCAVQLAPASIPHDRMREDTRYPKVLGDYILYEAAKVTGCPLWLRLLAFIAVLLNFSRG